MAEKSTKNRSKTAAPASKYPLFELSRRVVLASIGAVSLAQDELEAFVNRLVERGSIAEQEGKSILLEVREKRRKAREKIMQKTNQRFREVFDMPSKHDIELLREKIAELSKKIEALEGE